jgi:N utilization substance protein A
LAQALVEQGYLSFDDLSVIEPDVLMEMSGLASGQVDEIVESAEAKARDADEAAAEERRDRKDRDRRSSISQSDLAVAGGGLDPMALSASAAVDSAVPKEKDRLGGGSGEVDKVD